MGGGVGVQRDVIGKYNQKADVFLKEEIILIVGKTQAVTRE